MKMEGMLLSDRKLLQEGMASIRLKIAHFYDTEGEVLRKKLYEVID